MDDRRQLIIEDANIFYRNFSGMEKPPYNESGNRNFCVDIDPDIVDELVKDGWTVKFHKVGPVDDDPTYEARNAPLDFTRPYIQVRARYDRGRPPRIVMITSTARTNINEETIEILDSVDVEMVDLIVVGSRYSANGKIGVKAYLQSMFITIREDALELKYKIYEDSTPKD